MNIPTTGASPTPDTTDQLPSQMPPEQPAGAFHPDAVTQTPLSNVQTPEQILGPPGPAEGPSHWDVFMAKLHLAEIDSPTATLARQFSEPSGPSAFEMAKGGITPDYQTPAKPKLTPEEANKLYPGMPKPFSEPIDPDSADRIASVQKRRQDLMDIISQGPSLGRGVDALIGAGAGAAAGSMGGLPGAAAGLVAGAAFGAYGGAESVVVGMTDPLNLALMAATGGLLEGIPYIGGVLGKNIASNAAAQGIAIPGKLKEQQDVNLKDEALNVVGGAIGGTALHVITKLGMGGYGRRYSQGQQYARQADPATQRKMLETAIAQNEAGANVDMSAATFEMQRRADGDVHGTTSSYEFKPVDHPSNRTYYAARMAESGQPVEMGPYGPGLYAVDDGQVANNLAAAADSPMSGSVHEIQIAADAKILDLDKAPSSATTNPEDIRTQAIAEGYDGMRWVSQGDQPKNHLMLFDASNAVMGEEFRSNQATVPQMSPEEAQAAADKINDPKNSVLYEPGLDEKISESQKKTELTPEQDVVEAKAALTNHMASLKEMEKLDPSLLKDAAYQELLHMATQTKQESAVVKALVDCMSGGVE